MFYRLEVKILEDWWQLAYNVYGYELINDSIAELEWRQKLLPQDEVYRIREASGEERVIRTFEPGSNRRVDVNDRACP